MVFGTRLEWMLAKNSISHVILKTIYKNFEQISQGSLSTNLTQQTQQAQEPLLAFILMERYAELCLDQIFTWFFFLRKLYFI